MKRTEKRTEKTTVTRRLVRWTAVLAALAGWTVPGCEKTPPLGFRFVEKAPEAGLDFTHTDGSSGEYFIVETLASGVGLFDYDRDGDLDVYFPNGRPLPPPSPYSGKSDSGHPARAEESPRNFLYRNEGDGTFTDVTLEAGVPGVGFSVGCSVGDYDADGALDLYVTGLGSNVLYRNLGDGSFTDVTAEAGVDDTRFSAASAFVDIDDDDDLDLYVTNYCEVDFGTSTPCEHNGVPGYCAPGQYPPVEDALFLNLGDGTFRDISVESGITAAAKWGMGVVTMDYDRDGRIDIYVANDVSDNFLLRNLGERRFENIAIRTAVALSADGVEQGSMGVDAGDYDRDGGIDLIVTNYQAQLNALYHHEGDFFSEMSMAHGLGETCLPLVSWGTAFRDFDHDGWLDLFIANGHLEDRIAEYDQSSTYLQRNQVFRNEGGTFRDVTHLAGEALEELASSRGAAFGDIDNDGDIDIVVSNSRERPSLLVNEGGNEKSWVMFDLRGKENTFAIGARVTIEAGGVRRSAEVRSGGSYASQNDLRLHFGLGEAERVDSVTVRWPGGGTTSIESLAARTVHIIREE